MRLARPGGAPATTPEAAVQAAPTGAASRWGERALLALLALALLRFAAPVLVPVLCAAIVTLLLAPGVERLRLRGWPGWIAVGLVLVLPVAALCAVAFAARDELAGAVGRAQGALTSLADVAASAPWAAAPSRALRAWIADGDGGLATSMAHATLEAALGSAAAFMLVFFALLGQQALLASLLDAMPGRRSRIRLLGGLREARRGVGTYLVTMSVVNLALAVSTAAVLPALHIGHAASWGLAIFALLFVPYLGPLAITLLLLGA